MINACPSMKEIVSRIWIKIIFLLLLFLDKIVYREYGCLLL